MAEAAWSRSFGSWLSGSWVGREAARARTRLRICMLTNPPILHADRGMEIHTDSTKRTALIGFEPISDYVP
jgi:hypothetical protein